MLVPLPRIRVAFAIIEEQGRFLITQRQFSASFPGLWEFPSGRVEEGEADEVALKRQLLERIGIAVRAEADARRLAAHLRLLGCAAPPAMRTLHRRARTTAARNVRRESSLHFQARQGSQNGRLNSHSSFSSNGGHYEQVVCQSRCWFLDVCFDVRLFRIKRFIE
jgi:8-oxo-dGTP pyrophosphatase MutT (NUDIX family)